jgi:hypothetical protein
VVAHLLATCLSSRSILATYRDDESVAAKIAPSPSPGTPSLEVDIDAPVDAPVDAPCNAPVDAPIDAPIGDSIQLSDDLLLIYQINVSSDTTYEVCDKCTISMEAIYDGEAWVGIAVSTDGVMIGSEAVM